MESKRTIAPRCTYALFGAALLSAVGACSSGEGTAPTEVEVAASTPHEQGPSLSWESFQAAAEKSVHYVNGEKIYIVEWDIPIRAIDLYSYYTKNFVNVKKSAVDGLAAGGDNVWTSWNELTLTYCISTSFGTNYSRMQTEMARATSAWMSVANVNFQYVSAQDSNCIDSNTAVEIPVQPYSGGGACSFFPQQDGDPYCTSAGRALVIDVADIDSWPTTLINGNYYPNVTTEGSLQHELGHIIGLRHEQILNPADAVYNCVSEVTSPGNYRQLNPYNVESTMQYPWCNGDVNATQFVTVSDGLGATSLYGAPAWVAAL
jgi:hypothetical protein